MCQDILPTCLCAVSYNFTIKHDFVQQFIVLPTCLGAASYCLTNVSVRLAKVLPTCLCAASYGLTNMPLRRAVVLPTCLGAASYSFTNMPVWQAILLPTCLGAASYTAGNSQSFRQFWSHSYRIEGMEISHFLGSFGRTPIEGMGIPKIKL